MDIAYAFFADSATVPPDGKLYVMGGGYNTVGLRELPGRVGLVCVAGFRFNRVDTQQRTQVELRLVDADGKLVVPPADLNFQAQGNPPPDDREIAVPTVVVLQPMFGEAGDYRAEYWSGPRHLASIPLRVEVVPQPVES